MKRRTKRILLVFGVVIGLAMWPAYWQFTRIREYGQAEPLVEAIWPMAQEMKRFYSEHGRSPTSLDEISRYSPEHDFSALGSYGHEFTATGARRFFLRVNSRYAFAIDDQFRPRWVEGPVK